MDTNLKGQSRRGLLNLRLSSLQEHSQPRMRRKRLGNLRETMLKGSPFPKLHAKAAETKSLLEPVSAALQHLKDQDPSQQTELLLMVQVLDDSHSIDVLIDEIKGFKPTAAQANKLEKLVSSMNVGTTKLCHHFHNRNLFLFNFVPKNHYMFHLSQLGRHLSPKLAWCYMGEDLMHKVKVLAQGSFRGTPPKILGNKILAKYVIGLSYALSP